ncbi:MAG: 3-deoxy-7-phosphoheptulonate synthase [Clostridiales bacterium]|nr:3-deoxy-7-phosphoheptulonate synthase [Candidatus Crickella merdequi]
MIVELKKNATRDQIDLLENWLRDKGIRVTETQGEENVVLGLVGKAAKSIDEKMIESLEIVETTKSVKEPFKRANRKFHPEDSVIDINGVKIGGGNFAVIAGPCSVESPEQITEVAKAVQASGATLLRGGAFKPRTSPYDFQGMKAEGLELLELAKAETGMPLVTEIMNAAHLPLFENVEVLQVGARNMQNFELLKAVGRTNKTVLLKRGLANTLKELLMSAEYIMSEGNPNVILCERGIRTFETHTRNTLDLSAVPALKELSHLPVVIDPSHATGIARMVEPMAMAAAAAGADGLMIEVHNDPAHALCDGPQSLTPAQFDRVMKRVNLIREAMNADI